MKNFLNTCPSSRNVSRETFSKIKKRYILKRNAQNYNLINFSHYLSNASNQHQHRTNAYNNKRQLAEQGLV